MEQVFAIGDSAIDKSQFIGVAIGRAGVDQRHIGILHRTADSPHQFFHLAWHCRLKNDDELPAYLQLWIAPQFDPDRLRILAAFCRRVWRKNSQGGIPYAFSKPVGAIDPATGGFLIGPTCFGLTCASFVLAIFEHAGLRLAEYASWPTDRPGDRQWQEQIIDTLASGYAPPDHIEHIKTEIGTVRFRPEEVAAVAALAPPSASFQNAEALSKAIVARCTG